MFATMLRWVSIAPLATPVVPPVYCRNAMSSGPDLDAGPIAACAGGERVVEAHRAWNRIGRHQFLDVAHDEIHDRPFIGTEHVAEAGNDAHA